MLSTCAFSHWRAVDNYPATSTRSLPSNHLTKSISTHFFPSCVHRSPQLHWRLLHLQVAPLRISLQPDELPLSPRGRLLTCLLSREVTLTPNPPLLRTRCALPQICVRLVLLQSLDADLGSGCRTQVGPTQSASMGSKVLLLLLLAPFVVITHA